MNLCFDVALLGGLAVPLCGFGEILRYTLAHLVHGPEEHLRVRAAMLGERPKKLQSRRVVTSVVSRLPVLQGSRYRTAC